MDEEDDANADDLTAVFWTDRPSRERDITLGTRVYKKFQGTGFQGRVTDLKTEGAKDRPEGVNYLYHVTYEDEDHEDMSAAEVRIAA